MAVCVNSAVGTESQVAPVSRHLYESASLTLNGGQWWRRDVALTSRELGLFEDRSESGCLRRRQPIGEVEETDKTPKADLVGRRAVRA